MFRRLFLLLLLPAALLPLRPATAAVVITFWSHERDENFPHAFFTLNGTPDAGGAALDANYGFTAKAVTPAILLGKVAGKIEILPLEYMQRSDARFSVTLSDAQLADIQALVTAWQSDSRYSLNKRNCVHFVAEAARRSGLVVPELPRLMKKPRSFLLAVGGANTGRITLLDLPGKAYFAARVGPVPTARATAGAPRPGDAASTGAPSERAN